MEDLGDFGPITLYPINPSHRVLFGGEIGGRNIRYATLNFTKLNSLINLTNNK